MQQNYEKRVEPREKWKISEKCDLTMKEKISKEGKKSKKT